MYPAITPTTTTALPPRTTEPLLLGAGLFSASLFSPTLLDAALALNLALLVTVGVLHVAAASLSRARAETWRPLPRRWAREPFVSIHVPISNEPPQVVARTLDALSRLEWSEYEVIVLDNNTRDEGIWRPVERRCARLGPRFRFRHVPRLEGAKASALNLCLDDSDPRTELVLVVDADYRVHPKLLARAARYFDQPGVSHVQFPQAYTRDSGAEGLVGEYGSYFDAFLPVADTAEATLLTGTLCLVQRRALDLAGGWSAATITEDAELGVRLLEHGYSGRFAPEVAGRGMLPGDLSALRRQRRRWVFGNAQTLFQLGLGSLRNLGLKRSLAVVAQLTAWWNFLLLPALALPLLAFVPKAADAHDLALLAAAAAFPLHLLARAAVYALAPKLVEERKGLVRTFVAHLGLSWEGASAWLEALFGLRLAFQRTSKVPRTGSVRDAALPLSFAAVLTVSAGGLLWRGHVGAALASLMGALMFTAVLYLQRELQRAATGSQEAPAHSPEPALTALGALRSQHGFSAHQRHDPDLQPRWHLPRTSDRKRASADVHEVHRHGGG